MIKKETSDAMKDDNFVKVSKFMYNNKQFTLSEILLISNILSLEIGGRKCYYSYTQWSDILRCSEKTVGRIINKLKNENWIYWEMGNTGKSNTYHTTTKLHKLITEQEYKFD